jgi:large subunit ribosomal protein L4
MKVQLIKASGKKETAVVSKDLFGASVNEPLLSQAVRVYFSNLRQGTSRVQTRSEVSRTKRKWYRQKGTGNARHGARSAHIFVGGGVAHGPKGLTDWTRDLSQSMKRQALISALSAQASKVVIHEGIDKVDKTKAAQALISQVNGEGSHNTLLILPEYNEVVVRNFRNLKTVEVTTAGRLNALKVSQADTIVFAPDALIVLERRLLPAKKTAVKAAKKPVAAKEEKKTEKKTA